MKKLLVFPVVSACLAFVSCETPMGGSGGSARYSAYDVPASKPANPGKVRVKVSLRNQAVYVLEGSRALLVMPVSVGTTRNPTPRGNFRIYLKEAKRRANTHGYAYRGNSIVQTYLARKPAGWKFKGTPMPYWCEFTPAYGFHTGWMKPYPCTFGCLRMHENVAPKFFSLVQVGTPVNISTTQPEDTTIGRNIPRPPDAGPLPDHPPSFYLGNAYFTKHKTPKYR